jgi:hypothetical protein
MTLNGSSIYRNVLVRNPDPVGGRICTVNTYDHLRGRETGFHDFL